jgi:ribosomal protein S18 acetylase RimI-like enzyme
MPRAKYIITTPREIDGLALLKLVSKIEIFKPEDLACVQELWEEFLHSKNEPDRYHFIIAKEGDQLIGFACFGHRPLTEGTYDLYWLAVDPAFRHGGIGHSLLTSVEGEIQTLDGYLVVIETSSLKSFASTRTFYLACGYQQIVQIPDFYGLGDDMVVFTKKLRRGNGS